MKVLTPEEVYFLKDALPIGPPELADFEVDDPVIVSLVRRGLMLFEQDPEKYYWQTSPLGQQALRCHAAYLSSIGAQS